MSLGDCPRRSNKEELIVRLRGGETLMVDRTDTTELDDLLDLVAEGLVVSSYVQDDEHSSALKFRWKGTGRPFLHETLQAIQPYLEAAWDALQRGDRIEHARLMRLVTECIARDWNEEEPHTPTDDLVAYLRRVNARHCDFFDTEFTGNKTNRPLLLGEGNIAWPKGWTHEMAADYRRAYGLTAPGK